MLEFRKVECNNSQSAESSRVMGEINLVVTFGGFLNDFFLILKFIDKYNTIHNINKQTMTLQN